MQKFSSAEEVANDLVEQDVPLIQKIMNVAPDLLRIITLMIFIMH